MEEWFFLAKLQMIKSITSEGSSAMADKAKVDAILAFTRCSRMFKNIFPTLKLPCESSHQFELICNSTNSLILQKNKTNKFKKRNTENKMDLKIIQKGPNAYNFPNRTPKRKNI